MSRLTINLKAIRKNYALICDKVGSNCTASAVVKANAYGLGIKPIAEALLNTGADEFLVATIEEALELRNIIGNAPKVFTLSGFIENNAHDYLHADITPILSSMHQLTSYQALAASNNQTLPSILHFDTAMNRLGIKADNANTIANDHAGIDILYIMSHFACSEENHDLNDTQYKRLKDIAAHFPQTSKSLCNSSGIFQSSNYHFNMVRPGMALYGLNPTPKRANPMELTIKLEAPALQIHTALKNETCGYGATYTFTKNTPLAIIELGYADGFSRTLSNNGALYWKNYKCPIRGRISMDLTIIDLSAVPENEIPVPGDMIEIIGENQSADDLARDAETISYEILTSLGRRYKRTYIN